jgi:branched-chain amino acid aminotransferase
MYRSDVDFFFKKGVFYSISKFNTLDENLSSAYEVLRVKNSKVLFLNEHLERLENSLLISEKNSIFDKEEINSILTELIQMNRILDGNIMLISMPNSEKIEFEAFFISHFYPTQIMNEKGVDVKLMNAERPNPNAKISNLETRQKANLLIKEEHIFETLLVNHKNEITEGSRSNVFFVQGKTLFTAPLKDVLGGIIRNKVLEMIEAMNLTIVEKSIRVSDLEKYDSAFLTGTSLHILPIHSIDQQIFKTDSSFLQNLIKSFQDFIQESCDSNH